MIIHKMISNTKNAMAPRGMNLFCSKSVFMIGIFLMLAAKLFSDDMTAISIQDDFGHVSGEAFLFSRHLCA